MPSKSVNATRSSASASSPAGNCLNMSPSNRQRPVPLTVLIPVFRGSARWALALAMVAGLSACVKQYQPPNENEAAALVKLKLGYDDAKARSLLPGDGQNEAVNVALYLREGEERYAVYSQKYDSAFATAEPAVLEIHGARVRPGKAVTFEVRLELFWQTQEWESVTRQYRIPVTREVTVREYDRRTKSYTTRTTTVTDYVIETRPEQELMTRDHSRGCTAAVSFAPVQDEVYLLDYTNPEIVADCTLFAYRQQPNVDGTFRLEPVAAGFVQ